MNNAIYFILGRARVVITIVIVGFLSGLASFNSLPREAEPDVTVNYLSITVRLSGAAPEDIERLIIKPLEQELSSLTEIEEKQSFATEGIAYLGLEFPINFDPDQALIDVREKVDMAKRYFPSETEEPVVEEYNETTFPLLSVSLFGEVPDRSLNRLAIELQDILESVPGVLKAEISGQREDILEIIIDPAKLSDLGLTSPEILTIISQNNRLVTAGSVAQDRGDYSLKVPGLIAGPKELLSLPLRVKGDSVTTLGDVAQVKQSFKDRRSFSSVNGESAITLSVSKRIGANVVDVSKLVEAAVERFEKDLPSSVKITMVGDAAHWTKATLTALQSSIMTAIILVMIIVVAALGIRSGLLVGTAVPTSFMLAFLLLGMSGGTLNGVTMFALVLAVGILVDGAIVVVEYADRKLAEGLPTKEAYGLASSRMFWPIISSTGTTLCAFLPFLFWDSTEGQFMRALPITLSFVLTASVITALYFVPVLGSSIPGFIPKVDRNKTKALAADNDSDPRALTGFTGWYTRRISTLVHRPFIALLSVALILGTVAFAVWRTNIRTEYFVNFEPDLIFVYVKARGNLSAKEKYNLVKTTEQRLFDLEGIELLVSRTLQNSPPFGFGSPPNDAIGVVEVYSFQDGDPRRQDGFQIEKQIRERVRDMPGVLIDVRLEEMGPPVGKPIEITLLGDDVENLSRLADSYIELLDSIDGVIEIEDTRPSPGIEMKIETDREKAGALGASVAEIGTSVQLLTDGALVGTYRPDDLDDEVDIRVRYPKEDRSLGRLENLRINTARGAVPLEQFVQISPAKKIGSILRQNGKQMVRIRAALDPEIRVNGGTLIDANYVFDLVKSWQKEQAVTENIEVVLGGANEKSGNAGDFFRVAMASALFMMGVILLLQFNNFYHMFLTLFSVLLSTMGVMLGVVITSWMASFGLFIGLPYISTMLTGVGIVALAGIVVNNNIVLIDTYQRFLASDYNPVEAAIRTAAQRFRPVILTTSTTICGLLPMLLGISLIYADATIEIGQRAALIWVPLAQAVIWGLGFSTLLTLVLTPVLLALPSKMSVYYTQIFAVAWANWLRFVGALKRS